jgi:type VI secretion system secreted protein VgrG
MPILDFTCALGTPFDVRSFHVEEGVSRPFSVELTLVSRDASLDLGAVIGKPASLHLETGYAHAPGGRTFTGVCSFATRVRGVAEGAGGSAALSTYALRLVPTLWLLTQRTNHRTFQHLSIPEIADELLNEWGIQPKWRIDRAAHPKLEIKLQYGETDHNFLHRLLEEAGIAYVLADEDGGTALVLSDDLARLPVRTWPAVSYEPSPNEAAERAFVTDLSVTHDVRPAAHQIVDYDFRRPAFPLRAEAPLAEDGDPLHEIYEYRPGAFRVEGAKPEATPVADDKGVARHDTSYGEGRVDRHLDAHRTGQRLISFRTNVAELAPGVAVPIAHAGDEFDEPTLVVGKGMSGSAGGDWNQTARAVFVSDPVRPPLRTRKPRIYAVQTATVVGPRGQEIHCDEWGRVRAQFPWDRGAKGDEESGPWMRVSQGWAGTGFGMIQLPRVGQEVLVAFLDGDPDEPIVVGRVFNALEPVPYKLPENKTVSGWRTSSSPGGGGYSEIKFEDRAGKEHVYHQAQRDRHELVKRDEAERIERDHRHAVGRDQHLAVLRTKREHVVGDDHLHVEGDRLQKIDGSTSLEVGVDRNEKVGGKHAFEAGDEIHLQAGRHIVLDAGARLTISGPGGFIDIHSGGVDIVGTIVNINSGGSAGSGSAASPKTPDDADEARPEDTPVDLDAAPTPAVSGQGDPSA